MSDDPMHTPAPKGVLTSGIHKGELLAAGMHISIHCDTALGWHYQDECRPKPTGAALRDAGMAATEQASDDWSRAVIDQALATFAAAGRPFSANDLRPLLPPGIRPALVGARFMAASKRREIVKVGWVASTDPGTHAHPVGLWLRADVATEAA